MYWGPKWRRSSSMGKIDPTEWRTWLRSEYGKLSRRLDADLATGRINQALYEQRLDALRQDLAQALQRYR